MEFRIVVIVSQAAFIPVGSEACGLLFDSVLLLSVFFRLLQISRGNCLLDGLFGRFT
jgi:hypothetical protein